MSSRGDEIFFKSFPLIESYTVLAYKTEIKVFSIYTEALGRGSAV